MRFPNSKSQAQTVQDCLSWMAVLWKFLLWIELISLFRELPSTGHGSPSGATHITSGLFWTGCSSGNGKSAPCPVSVSPLDNSTSPHTYLYSTFLNGRTLSYVFCCFVVTFMWCISLTINSFNLTSTLWGWYCFPHYRTEEARTQMWSLLSKGKRSVKWQSWEPQDSNSGMSNVKACAPSIVLWNLSE